MNIPPVSSSVPKITQPADGPRRGSSLQKVGETFQQALDGLEEMQAGSDNLLQKLAAGEDVDIHQVMIATEETDISFRIALAIRDRLVDSYREVMRMTV